MYMYISFICKQFLKSIQVHNGDIRKFYMNRGCQYGQEKYARLYQPENAKQYEPPYDKTNNVDVRLAKTQISLGIHPV